MDEDGSFAALPRLDRQQRQTTLDASGRPLTPARVPETRPTPLERAFIPFSVIALACGVLAITALELGVPLGTPLVRFPVLLGGLLLVAVTGDAVVRVWRSAIAWRAVDPRRAWFRLVWVAVLAALLGLVILAVWAALTA